MYLLVINLLNDLKEVHILFSGGMYKIHCWKVETSIIIFELSAYPQISSFVDQMMAANAVFGKSEIPDCSFY